MRNAKLVHRSLVSLGNAHPSRRSRSTLTTVCFCATIFPVLSSFSLCSCLRVCSPSPDPSSACHRHLVVECGIHGQQNTNPANLQCCCSTEGRETGFVPTSAQFFTVSTFLILRSQSWTRSCIQEYHVSMRPVHCPAPNRSVKEFAVELPLCISIFIGSPRSWKIDLKGNPT